MSKPAVAATATLELDIKTFRFNWNDVKDASYYKLLENPDGLSGFSQIGSDIMPGVQTYDHIVPLYSRTNARYTLQSCNASGCTDDTSIDISSSLQAAIAYIKAGNTGAGDQFGRSVSLSAEGNILAVGAYGENGSTTSVSGTYNDDADNAGAVYIFTRSGSNWSQQAYIKGSNTEAGDRFGIAVSLSSDGNTLAVGANYEDSDATGINNADNNNASSSGAVYIFQRNETTWEQQAYIKASNAEAGDEFGVDVSLSDDGDTLAVGAFGEDSNIIGINAAGTNNDALFSGAVYIFNRNSVAWTQQISIKASNAGEYDQFGWSVDLSGDGNTLAVGAPGEASDAIGVNSTGIDTAENAGAVYIYHRSATTWSEQVYIKASNTGLLDWFGVTVSLSGNGDTLAVGAIGESSDATGIDAVDNDNADNAGAVYIFSRSVDVWSQQAYIKADNTGVEDKFGWSVSLSTNGNQLAVGGSGESSSATGINGADNDNAVNAGAAYMFRRNAGVWSQQAYIKSNNTDAKDQFGISVCISGDGNTLSVGADFEDSDATGVDGADNNNALSSGAVYLY